MPHSRIHDDLALHGPDGRIRLDPAEAMAWCHELTNGHQENFSVLSRLVPSDVRDDFAAFYAFCRTADDLGDEKALPANANQIGTMTGRSLAAVIPPHDELSSKSEEAGAAEAI